MLLFYTSIFYKHTKSREKPQVNQKMTERCSTMYLYVGFEVYFITVPQNSSEFNNRGNKFSKAAHFSTANIKVLRGSLGALSVNKLSHIPKLQPISAVYENQ